MNLVTTSESETEPEGTHFTTTETEESEESEEGTDE